MYKLIIKNRDYKIEFGNKTILEGNAPIQFEDEQGRMLYISPKMIMELGRDFISYKNQIEADEDIKWEGI